MAEVEVKYRVTDLGSVESAMARLGARLVKVEREEDTYLQHPCRDFRASDEALRLRVINGERVELTYKGPRSGGDIKSRLEITVGLRGDPDSALRLLESLGFERVATVSKVRRFYVVPGTKVVVCLDDVEGLGSFVEIEAQGSPEEVSGEVEAVARKLGLRGPPLSKTYLELLLEGGRHREGGPQRSGRSASSRAREVS